MDRWPDAGRPAPGGGGRHRDGADCDAEPVLVWDHVKNRVADYLAEYGRPEQIAAWYEDRPYVADLAENSAGGAGASMGR